MAEEEPISAEPTKTFFVEMLIRDIALEQAVLDLLDNSVDGAKREVAEKEEPDFEGKEVRIKLSSESFEIFDNCGGFSRKIARDYAFRFGRPKGAERTPHSIGQFGVGMKRALFKFGKHFRVDSATRDEQWAVDVDVDSWEMNPDWTFPWAEESEAKVSTEGPGTHIVVSNLRKEVSARFSSSNFHQLIVSLIKARHRQFIAEGLKVFVNETRVEATDLNLLISDNFTPGVELFERTYGGNAPVSVRIVTGVGPSSPREAGWYVICNGRVVLSADRRSITGWGVVETANEKITIPTYHNQFARFRGIVWFDSSDSSQVPWNTTKDDIDQDSPIWQESYEKMVQMMRPLIDFLNELDRDIDEYTRDKSPLLDFVNKLPQKKSETLTQASVFTAPARDTVQRGKKYIKIQYSRPADDVELLQNELELRSAKAVGEKTFDMILSRFSDE